MKRQRTRHWLACAALAVLASTAAHAGQDQPIDASQTPEAAIEREAAREQLEQEEGELRERLREIERARRGRWPPSSRGIFRVRQDYTLAADETVREVSSYLGDVTLYGRVERDVVVVLGSAHLGATAQIDGSLVVVGGSAEIEPGASVRQDLVVAGGTVRAPADFTPGGNHVAIGTPALLTGIERVQPWLTRGLLWGRLIVPDLHWIWKIVGVLFLVYLVLNTVLDRPVAASADVLTRRPLHAFLGGLLVLLLAIPALAIVAASVIGLAVVPILLCALVAIALVGKVAVARAIGRAVLRPESPDRRLQAFATFIIGAAVLTLAYMVPALGFVTWALASVLGLGAAFVTFRSYLHRERPAPARAAVPDVVGVTSGGPEVHNGAAPAIEDAGGPFVSDAAVPPPRAPAFTEGLARYPRATFLDRAAAFALDCILVAIIHVIFGADRYEGFYFAMLLAYHVGFWAWKGTTLGGIVCGLRVVRTHGTDLRFVDALVRGLSGVLSIAALGIGCLWMITDPERQTWHDQIAGTLVVKVPRELVLP